MISEINIKNSNNINFDSNLTKTNLSMSSDLTQLRTPLTLSPQTNEDLNVKISKSKLTKD